MQAMFDSQGDQVSVQLHKSCYCSYTSKYHINKLEPRKRKVLPDSIDANVASPPVRIRRPQVREFEFKRHCLYYSVLNPVNLSIVGIQTDGTG